MIHSNVSRAFSASFGAFLGLLFLVAPATAQNGSLYGTVVDAASGETLIGASVVLEGTTTGATADIDGRYEIKNVPPGTYALVFSYIGYDTKTVRGVRVTAGQATKVDLSLVEEAVGLGEVVVEAAALENTEGALLRERQKAAAVSDAISAEAISRTGSSTAADALQKVTGASVVGGRYVYVRGLGDRYTSTQLNGATLPSADPNRNAVPLDLFPAGLLDNIVTTKTFTPDRPGSFTGGSVNIGTKAFPEHFTLSFSASTGYNTNTSLQEGFLTYNTGGMDWTGLGGGVRDIPAAWEGTTATPNPILARRDPALAQQLDALARSFDPVMAPVAVTAPADRSYSFGVGNQVSLFGRPFGFLGSLSYDRDFGGYSGGLSTLYTLSGAGAEELSLQQRLLDTRSTDDVLWGGLATLSYKPSGNHSVGTTLMYNRSATSETRLLTGSVPRSFSDPNRRLESRVLGYTGREVYSLQLNGESHLPRLGGARIDWTASRLGTSQEEPDLRFFANDYTLVDGESGVDTAYAIAVSNYSRPSRYFRSLEETGWDANLNVSLPVSTNGTLKLGGAVNTRERAAWERRFEYVPEVAYDGDPGSFFSQVGVVDTVQSSTGPRFVFGNYIIDASSPRNNYEGDQTVGAGYGMIDLRLRSRLRLITGVRFETTRIDVVSRDTSVGEARLRNGDWLPSVNLVYELGRMNFRAAYGRTLARPTFRELAPFTTFMFINSPTVTGNPLLERTLVDNFDLRWEWFARPGEIVAVSGFYKRFADPIERTIISNNFETTFRNVDDANVYGAEFEARKRLDEVAAALSRFELGANVSLTHSEVDVPEDELVEIRAFNPDASATRALQGQSAYVVNGDLSYNFERGSVSLLYNVFGRRISEVSIGGTPNIYELPFHSLDLTAGYRFWRGLQLKASARNLLDQEVRRSYPYRGREYDAERYAPGRTFSLGVSYQVQ